ncbi:MULTISPECIES: Crp/Fnr family transcriptional regulator [unclassified Pseudomonas]|uniref:Crp/Fnr family transcriptional regulator n=1 Tax=unclassified Pseudomonas TaxID=196821 RepID=UPI000EEE1519|nr:MULTISPECIES: Crp/Fnr family transcriptional regulator [unclassified Pseudomonas]HBZ93269.1 Crp/Fnr family transcriptional regulator [Pseudomonas sp.]
MDTPSDTDSLLAVLEKDEWFSTCAIELKRALIRDAKMHDYAAGEALYREGEFARHALFCVIEGAVRLSSSLHDGTPSLLVYLEPCHWFGDISLIDGRPYIRDAIADVDTRILCVPMQAFTQWLDHNPRHWRDIARLSINKLRVAYQVIGEPGALHHRLARRLWLMAQGFGSRTQTPSLQLNVSQEHLAQMMGTTRQSINAALARLEGLGLVVQGYRTIELRDLKSLLDHANRLDVEGPADRS